MSTVRDERRRGSGDGTELAAPLSQYEFYSSLDLDKPSCPDRTLVLLDLLRNAAATAGAVSRVLDLGCGEGFQASLAYEVVAPATVVGVDWSAGALQRAKTRPL